MRRSFVCLAVLTLTFGIGTARADSTNSIATAAFREGREALKQGNYDLACEKFRVSDEAEPSSGARLNLGDCALRRNQYVEAEQLFRGAALLADGEKKSFAEQRAAAARALAGTLRLRWAAGKPPGSRVDIDGHAVEVPADLPVNPGKHVIRVFAPGFAEAPQSVDVASGGSAQVNLAALPVASPPVARPPAEERPPPPAAEGRRSRSPIAYVLLGLGGAALAGGVVTALVAKGARDDLDSKCSGQKPCAADIWARGDVQDDYDKSKTWALVSTTCFIGGAVSLVAGGTLWLVTAPTPGGQTVSVAGRF